VPLLAVSAPLAWLLPHQPKRAHGGSVRACRYNKEVNRLEWFAGFDSVDRDYALFKILPGAGQVTLADLDPAYIGSVKQCQDRAITLRLTDPSGRYVVYDMATGKPYREETKLNYKKI